MPVGSSLYGGYLIEIGLRPILSYDVAITFKLRQAKLRSIHFMALLRGCELKQTGFSIFLHFHWHEVDPFGWFAKFSIMLSLSIAPNSCLTPSHRENHIGHGQLTTGFILLSVTIWHGFMMQPMPSKTFEYLCIMLSRVVVVLSTLKGKWISPRSSNDFNRSIGGGRLLTINLKVSLALLWLHVNVHSSIESSCKPLVWH